jgi:N utilization substance protein B
MTRTTARQIALQLEFSAASTGETAGAVFEEFFTREHYSTLAAENKLFADYPDEKQLEYIRTLTSLLDEHRPEFNAYIEKYSRGWKLDRISRMARAIMRCAMCEILYVDDVPTAAAINEAVELSKSYDEPEASAFINGILGSFVKGETGESTE